MTAVLGVDGGQTTVRVRHSTDDRQIELEGAGRQDHDPVRAVGATVVDGWRRLGEPHVERVVLGLSTAPVEMEALDRLAQSVADALGAREVWITDDAVPAHVERRPDSDREVLTDLADRIEEWVGTGG